MKLTNALVEKYWHFGCHMSQVSKPGDFVLIKIANRQVAIINDNNEIRAFDNVCPHRGAFIYADNYGNAAPVCKYHGWSLSHGKTNRPNDSNYERPACSFKFFQIGYCGSLIFFAMDPHTSLDEQITSDLFSVIEDMSFGFGSLHDNNSYIYQSPWMVAVENALEPDHVPFVHINTLGVLDLVNYRNSYYGFNNIVDFDVGNQRYKKMLSSLKVYFDPNQMSQDFGYRSIFIFPFTFISTTFSYSFSVQTFFPKNIDQTWFSSWLYKGPLIKQSAASHMDSFFDSTASVNRQVFEEDHSVCKLITYDNWQASKVEGLSILEEKIRHFRNSLSIN